MRCNCLKHARFIMLMVAAACGDRLLDVQHPDIIEPGDLKGPAGATALYEGARSEFILAHDGTGGTYDYGTSDVGLATATGLLTDEFDLAVTTWVVLHETEARLIGRGWTMITLQFLGLHRARSALDLAAAALQRSGNPTTKLGEVRTLGAYIYTLFGETFCSGVPFSHVVDGVIEPGEPISTQAMFEEALRRFGEAEGETAGDPDLANLIRVGRGRTLLNLGKFAEAAQAAAAVPTRFRFENAHSNTPRGTQNAVHGNTWLGYQIGVGNEKGTNGLDFVGANDPRVPVVEAGVGPWGNPIFFPLVYEQPGAPVVLASGIEARLIEAEVALRRGDTVAWLKYLNQARTPFGLGPLTDPGTDSSRVNLMFRERAFALFGTAHRLGDLRRLIRQYGRSADEVFPIGRTFTGHSRGTQVALPVPQAEENNPKYQASDCDPSQP